MSTKRKYLIYRGYVRGITSHDGTLIFATEHGEGQPMGVYFINPEQNTSKKLALGGGGTSILKSDQHVFVTCTDGHVYRANVDGSAIEPLGEAYKDAPTSVTLASNGRLAVASGKTIDIVSIADGQKQQTIELPERVTVLASDKSGEWIVAGTDRGMLFVYETEDKTAYAPSASAKLHEGAVSVLLFEEDELRVLSTGSDQRLLVTHVRGELDSEDRGGSGMHEKRVMGMINGPSDRFYSVGLDSSVKAWPAGRNNKRPTTLKDGVVKANDLTMVKFNDRPHLAVAGRDGTIRIYSLDEEGKVEEAQLILHDSFAWANNEFSQKETKRREFALKKLAQFNDTKSLNMISERVNAETDHKLKVLATQLLGESDNVKAIKLLRDHIYASAEDVRVAAFHGLRKLEGQDNLKPLDLALGANKKDIGVLAVNALAELAKGDDKAFDKLSGALDASTYEVRMAAFAAIEAHYPANTPDAYLLAFKSSQNDVRTASLVRCFQLGLLDETRVSANVRRMYEDHNANVRLNAFLVSLLKRPTLARALRSRDDVINRQLFDIETFGKPKEAEEDREPPKVALVLVSELTQKDYEPLLEAMASRALDTCMRGAQGLALLQDTRAFGTLLQLSRESQENARVQAAQSLEALGDVRSLKRLRMMLRDNAPAVRDAAFSALVKIEDAPLNAARSGLAAEHEDIRRRGLQVLVQYLREENATDTTALDMLSRTLNDGFNNVRSEAFKASLNLKVGGTEESALRFANQSFHSDVRLDVLVEVMAQVKEAWAWTMLLEFFEDPEQTIRAEAFEFSLKKVKRDRRRESLEAALNSRYSDVRLSSVKELTERSLDDFAELIVKALDDEAEEVRQTAVSALVSADAQELLERALESKHDDVRVRAAVACAQLGNPKALPVLLELATAERPTQENGIKKSEKDWLDHVVKSLGGLEELGDLSALERIAPLIGSKTAKIRKATVRAMVWSSRRSSLDVLREVIRHSDKDVKKEAALGLAYYGDSSGASMIFGNNNISANEALMASLGLLEEAEDQFLAFLDRSDERLRKRAFLLLLLLELSEQDGIPDKCLAALSSEYADVRFDAAQGLELFTNKQAFAQFVYSRFNNLHDGKLAWEIEPAVINKLSLALTFGGAQVRIRAARLLESLHEDSPEKFERGWEIYHKRYRAELDRLEREERKGESISNKLSKAWRFIKSAVGVESKEDNAGFENALIQLVFGAYVGLSRQSADAVIRKGAIERLSIIARRSDALMQDAQRVLILGLGDPHEGVRQSAFDHLNDLGLDPNVLANEALSSPHRDMGARGLQLLSERGGAEEGQALLKDVMLNKTDGLEQEAAKLLAEQIGWVATHKVALGAASESLRHDAVPSLMREYDASEEAVAALIGALTSRFEDVRFKVAEQLATKKRTEAFGVLTEMVEHENQNIQRRGINSFKRLGDKQAATIMLDRIDNDEAKTADASALLSAAASFRDRSIVERLFEAIDSNQNRWDAFQAALTISGFDQTIEDADEERDDQSWQEKQHERHDDILARLIDIAYRLADSRMLGVMIYPHARWSKSDAVDEVLVPLANFSKDSIQHAAIEAMGWRLRKRNGPVDGLLKILSSGAPVSQFLAAEGLALAGRKDGISVLMTAVNFMDDYDHRRRAVLALGKLGDPQAMDLLLELLTDSSSNLRAPAAEAIGHMSTTSRADEIFKTLVELSKGYYDLAESAMTGLRWFNTPDAWRQIRERAENGGWWIRDRAARLLRFNPDEANIEMLTKLLREDNDSDVAGTSAESLRKIYGPDSLETDYILVTARFNYLDEQDKTIERLREKGDPARILEVLPRIQSQNEEKFLKPLVAMLLGMDPLPIDDVADLLKSTETRTASVAAQIIGRAGKLALKHADTLTEALSGAHDQYMETWDGFIARKKNARAKLIDIASRYRLLLWATGRLEIGLDEVVKASKLPTIFETSQVGEEALLVLSQSWVGERGIDTLEEAARGTNAKLRTLASVSLRNIAPERAKALLKGALEDGPSFNQLVADQDDEHTMTVLRDASTGVHYQGVVLPHLVQRGDIEGLTAILQNGKLSDEIRFGAIEGLSQIATEEVDDILAALGKDEAEDEELRMEAWRAFRRGRRLRARREAQQSLQEEVRG